MNVSVNVTKESPSEPPTVPPYRPVTVLPDAIVPPASAMNMTTMIRSPALNAVEVGVAFHAMAAFAMPVSALVADANAPRSLLVHRCTSAFKPAFAVELPSRAQILKLIVPAIVTPAASGGLIHPTIVVPPEVSVH